MTRCAPCVSSRSWNIGSHPSASHVNVADKLQKKVLATTLLGLNTTMAVSFEPVVVCSDIPRLGEAPSRATDTAASIAFIPIVVLDDRL